MGIFRRMFGAKAQYLQLSTYEQEKKDNNVRLAVQSFILTGVGTVLTILFVVLGALCSANLASTEIGDGQTNFPILSLLGAIAFFLIAFVFLMVLLRGINFAVYQRKLNKRKVGLAALIVNLVCLAATIIATIVILVVMI